MLFYFLILFLYTNKKVSKVFSLIIISLLIFSEIIINCIISYNFTIKNSEYISNYNAYETVIEKNKNDDNGFYREEFAKADVSMNPPLYGYNGISAFSSIISNKVSKTEYLLGLSGNYHNFYQYYPQTPIYNSIHNLKYVNSNNSIKLNEDFYH